jgi:arabinogalactan oligomer / maltooligosaccharide transport system permease protein
MKLTQTKKPFSFVEFIFSTLAYSWLLASVVVVLLPLVWMVSAAFTRGSLLSGVPILPDPSKFSLEHFEYVFTYRSNLNSPFMYSDYIRAFLVTLSIAVVNTVGVVVMAVITGFAFARLRFKGKKQMLLLMMVLQMFPSFMGMIALFLLFRQFGMLNNPVYLALIYTAGSIPYNTFLVRGFMRNIPKSLDEAASIDGASPLQVLTQILFPLIVPIIGFIAVGAFMSPWLDFMLQSFFLQNENTTIAVWLYRLTEGQNSAYNPLHFMAGALIITIPIMIIQFFMQKYMVHGLVSGAEKG